MRRRIGSMNKQTLKQGWLIVVAALTMGMASCSNDDNITDDPSTTTAPQAVSTVHVTVGAGFDDADGTTRAGVTETEVDGRKQHTLYFTKGDSLFVYAEIAAITTYVLAGKLSIDESSISADGKSAKFTGDLSVYYNAAVVTASSWSFTDASNPIAECSSGTAYLIPKGAPSGLYEIENYLGYVHCYEKSIAADVNTLMKTALQVTGPLNTTTQSFTLGKVDPILNFNLGGLAPGVNYKVDLSFGGDETTYSTKYIADADGKVTFAVSNEGGSDDWTVNLTGVAYRYSYSLGTKDLSAKVYNVTRATATSSEYLGIETAKVNNQAGSLDYILKTFELNESTWSQQNGYSLLKFKYTLSYSPGVGISLDPIRTVTINVGGGRTYTVTDTRDDGYGGTLGFDTNFQFYVAMHTFNNKPLRITYDPHNNECVYTCIVANVTLAGGNVLDLGTIELVRKNL